MASYAPGVIVMAIITIKRAYETGAPCYLSPGNFYNLSPDGLGELTPGRRCDNGN
jgi:hypothetical protein